MSNALTRTSRSRPTTALLTWGGLLFVAWQLAQSRYHGNIHSVDTAGAMATPIVMLLAAFATFIAIFAWVLFNPQRRTLAESPFLFIAAGATLLPPPVISFCMMPVDSPLRGWVALAMFMICAIALLSHLPDDLAKVPRSLDTYLTPIPAFDGMKDDALDPTAAWFQFNELSEMVSDSPRPSLAPRVWLGREQTAERDRKTQIRPVSSVESLLGPESDLSLLDDPLWDPETEPETPAGRESTSLTAAHARPQALQDAEQEEEQQDADPFSQSASATAVAEAPSETQDEQKIDESGVSGKFVSPLTSSGLAASEEEEEAAADQFFASGVSTTLPQDEHTAAPPTESPKETASHVDRHLEDGVETVEGVLSVSFEAGQKRANLHIPFSPPLSAAPEIECESVGDEDVKLKVAVAQPWGVRVEVRRMTADDASTAEIGFHATAPEAA